MLNKNFRLSLILFGLATAIGATTSASTDLCLALLSNPISTSTSVTKDLPYGYVENKAWGEQIYVHELSDLEQTFAKIQNQPWPQQLQQLIQLDVRRYFFDLWVLSETYKTIDASFFSANVEFFKNFESLLGKVGLKQEMQSKPITISEPALVSFFKDEAASAASDLKAALDTAKFLEDPNKTFQDLEKKLQDYSNWLSAEKDREFLLSELIQFTSHLNNKIQKRAFDTDDLATGLHELRKKLREVVLHIVNLQHLIRLVDEGPLPPKLALWYEELERQNPNLLENPYMPEASSEVKNPILVPRKLIAMIGALVNIIGNIKDQDEPLVELQEAALKSPALTTEDRNRILEKIKLAGAALEDQKQVADKFQNRISDTDLLGQFIKFLQGQP